MKWSPSHRFVGTVTLLFAVCPSIELGLMMVPELIRASGDHLPVGVGAPPVWRFFVASLVLSTPWIVACILLLKRLPAGQWLALALTVPSVLLVMFFGGGALHGLCWVWIIEHNQMGLTTGLVFGPFALFGLMFCLTVWWFAASSGSRGDSTGEKRRAAPVVP